MQWRNQSLEFFLEVTKNSNMDSGETFGRRIPGFARIEGVQH